MNKNLCNLRSLNSKILIKDPKSMSKKSTFTKNEAKQIEALIEEKLQSSADKQKGIRQKIRNLGFYASDYDVSRGYTVADFRRVINIIGVSQMEIQPKSIEKPIPKETKPIVKKNIANDETYIIDICDEVLKLKAIRQHRFDFLRGHTGTKLPVDAYYPSIPLVIEYHEKQHAEEVGFFNKRITSTGINRGEQRKQYDDLRRSEIPKNDLQLVIFDYSDFSHSKSKRLLRNKEEDIKVIKQRLK